MKINFLGTSSASVTVDRDNTSILVESGADLILFDCGGNPAGKIIQFGYSPSDLRSIFLTHLHIDHCYGLPALLFHMFLEKRTSPIDLFCPAEEHDVLDAQLLAHGIGDDVRTYDVIKKSVSPVLNEKIWETDQTIVYSGISNHSRATRAYKIVERMTGRAMVFTGDTTPIDEIAVFSKNVDLLIHESTYLDSHKALAFEYGHSTAGQAAAIAKKAKVKALALIHFECPPGSSEQNYRSEAALVYPGYIYTPDDMSSISI